MIYHNLKISHMAYLSAVKFLYFLVLRIRIRVRTRARVRVRARVRARVRVWGRPTVT